MFIRLLGLLLGAIAALAVAVVLGIVAVLMLRFWPIALIVALFFWILYTFAEKANVQIDFADEQNPRL